MSELEPRQERFCREYIIDLNGTQAAIRAGYAENSAQEQASRLLSNAMVKARVDELKLKRNDRLDIKADDVLREVLRLAMVDITQAFDENGNLKPIKDIPEDVRRALSSIEVDELFEGSGKDREHVGRTRKVRFWDKVKSLELLGKHLSLFKDRVEHSADESLERMIAETFGKKPE